MLCDYAIWHFYLNMKTINVEKALESLLSTEENIWFDIIMNIIKIWNQDIYLFKSVSNISTLLKKYSISWHSRVIQLKYLR